MEKATNIDENTAMDTSIAMNSIGNRNAWQWCLMANVAAMVATHGNDDSNNGDSDGFGHDGEDDCVSNFYTGMATQC